MVVPRDTMRPIAIILIAGLLCGLVFLSGCTSTGPAPAAPGTVTPDQAGSPNLTPELKGLMLGLADLPDGYSLLHEGPTIPPEQAVSEKEKGYKGGYSFSAATYSGNRTGDTFEQTVLVFDAPGQSRDLAELFTSSFPQIAAWSPEALPDPGIGNQSIGYRYRVPETDAPAGQVIGGSVLLFRSGNTYEILMVQGGETNDSSILDLARKAAAKLD
jgi:hypothetical protein